MSLWMLTITGREHHLTGARVQQQTLDIYDIAWSLSQVNRFTGHAIRPYSVAEHSLFVADLAARDGKSPEVQLACLLHDAHEAYTGDQSTPAKNAIGLQWGVFEGLQADRCRRQLGVEEIFQRHRDLVRHYDLVALATERAQLTNYNPRHHAAWDVLDTPGHQVQPAKWANLGTLVATRRRWDEWRDLFMLRYFDLMRSVQAEAGQGAPGAAEALQ